MLQSKKKKSTDYTDYLISRRKEKFILCHPGGIYAVVETADASNCIDACGMTMKFCYNNKVFGYNSIPQHVAVIKKKEVHELKNTIKN